MPRICTCDNFKPGRPLQEGMCRNCWLYRQHMPTHRAQGGTGEWKNGTIVDGAPPPIHIPELNCVHLGQPTGEMRKCPSCTGDVDVKLFGCAIHTQCTVAKEVADIACCAKCPNKSTAILIPEPPPIECAPRSDRAVVTVAIGPAGEALLAASGDHMRHYAEVHRADFVVLRWPGHPRWPLSGKFQIPRALEHYSRIAYVDADVLLRPGCMDLFAACAEDEIGLVDELIHHRVQPQHGREKAYLAFRKRMGFKDVPHIPWMMNAGVMVVPRRYGHLLSSPAQPIEIEHCAEQDHTCSQILDAYLDGRCKVRLLDRRCNWQSWCSPPFAFAPHDAILHWSGAGQGRRDRVKEIQKMAERFPWPK